MEKITGSNQNMNQKFIDGRSVNKMYTEDEKILIIKDTIEFCRQAIVKAIRDDKSDLLTAKMMLEVIQNTTKEFK